ncbi:MAG: hypothetical protein HUJ26_20595 [Planctomycetaceae bacterium]|nr:hypothetical protein [Planctomycetaceae bacterium]
MALKHSDKLPPLAWIDAVILTAVLWGALGGYAWFGIYNSLTDDPEFASMLELSAALRYLCPLSVLPAIWRLMTNGAVSVNTVSLVVGLLGTCFMFLV